QRVVSRDARALLRLEAEQLAAPVVLGHHVIAGAEIRERLQRTPADAPLARNAAAEHLVVRQQDEPELAPHEPAPRGGDYEEELGGVGQRVPGLEHARLDTPQHVLRSQRLTAVRERDDDAMPGADEL